MTRIIRRSGKLWGLSRNPGAIARWPRHRFENCGVSILSFVVTRAKPLGLCAWSPASSIAVKKFSCGATNCSHFGKAPFDTGPDAALVAHYSSAELGCFLELGWPLPTNVIDLFAEHRVETNGRKSLCGKWPARSPRYSRAGPY